MFQRQDKQMIHNLMIGGAMLMIIIILMALVAMRHMSEAYEARLTAKDNEVTACGQRLTQTVAKDAKELETCQTALAAAQTPGAPVVAPVIRTATCTPAARVESPSLPDGPYPDPSHCHVGDVRLIQHADRLWRVRVTDCPTLQGDDTPYTILGKSNPRNGSRDYQATDACNHGPRSYGNGEKVFLCEEASP